MNMSRARTLVPALFAVTSLAFGLPAVLAQNDVPAVTGNARVDKLLGQMTLAEKMSLIHDGREDPRDYQGQAGYVGGKYASAFADGQLRAERPLAEFGDAKLTAGGGAWGGAQKGAARLDIGPSASLQLKLGQTSSRLSMDWRFRVAGAAEPASGPALTISAGF